jgi:hypothetical protein
MTKKTCPQCGNKKDFYAIRCRSCTVWKKPLLGKKGSSHPTWKGGQMIDRDGYIKTYAPDHPFPRKSGYVYEHVRIVEISIGRRIKPDESVHHRNHDKKDNRLENLQIVKRGDHSSLHRRLDGHKRRRDNIGRYTADLH